MNRKGYYIRCTRTCGTRTCITNGKKKDTVWTYTVAAGVGNVDQVHALANELFLPSFSFSSGQGGLTSAVGNAKGPKAATEHALLLAKRFPGFSPMPLARDEMVVDPSRGEAIFKIEFIWQNPSSYGRGRLLSTIIASLDAEDDVSPDADSGEDEDLKLREEYIKAAQYVHFSVTCSVNSNLSPKLLLELFGKQKQIMHGDASSISQLVNEKSSSKELESFEDAQLSAWKKNAGKSPLECMREYIDEVDSRIPGWRNLVSIGSKKARSVHYVCVQKVVLEDIGSDGTHGTTPKNTRKVASSIIFEGDSTSALPSNMLFVDNTPDTAHSNSIDQSDTDGDNAICATKMKKDLKEFARLCVKDSSKWRECDMSSSKFKNISLFARCCEESKYKMIMTQFHSTLELETVYNLFSKLSASADDDMACNNLERRILKEYDDTSNLVQLQLPTPWPLKWRQTVFFEIKELDKDGADAFWVCRTPPNFRTFLQPSKKLVFCEFILSGWYITATPSSGTQISFVNLTDPGGYIPSSLYNKMVCNNCCVELEKMYALVQEVENSTVLMNKN